MGAREREITRQVTLFVPAKLHREIRSEAARRGLSMRQWYLELLRQGAVSITPASPSANCRRGEGPQPARSQD